MSADAFTIAERLPPLRAGATLDDARRVVERHCSHKPPRARSAIAQAYFELWLLRRAQ